MGRELKKVALNFQWEIGELWSGYVNPHKHHECKECEGLGWSKEYNELKDKWYSGNNPQWKPNPFSEKEKVSVFGSSTATKEEWMKMLDDGFVYHKEGNAIFV